VVERLPEHMGCGRMRTRCLRGSGEKRASRRRYGWQPPGRAECPA